MRRGETRREASRQADRQDEVRRDEAGQREAKRGEASRMDRFKPREDRFAFIVALGRTFISLQERSPDDLSRPPTMSNAARSNPFLAKCRSNNGGRGRAV